MGKHVCGQRTTFRNLSLYKAGLGNWVQVISLAFNPFYLLRHYACPCCNFKWLDPFQILWRQTQFLWVHMCNSNLVFRRWTFHNTSPNQMLFLPCCFLIFVRGKVIQVLYLCLAIYGQWFSALWIDMIVFNISSSSKKLCYGGWEVQKCLTMIYLEDSLTICSFRKTTRICFYLHHGTFLTEFWPCLQYML